MYREDNELLYVCNMINKEEYLKKLFKDIKNDSLIVLNSTPIFIHQYDNNEVMESLSFFEDMGLSLHDVYLKSNNQIKLDNPRNIKIIADYLNDTSEVYFDYDKDDNEYVDSIKLTFSPRRNSAISYLHEIVHTQVTIYNNVQMIDDTHEELLPIFIELLAAKVYGIGYYTNFRLKELAYDIFKFYTADNKYDKFIYATYIKSTLKAFKLLDIYLSSNVRVKEDMMRRIQNVFDSKIRVEDLLKEYNITYDNSKVKLSKLKRI